MKLTSANPTEQSIGMTGWLTIPRHEYAQAIDLAELYLPAKSQLRADLAIAIQHEGARAGNTAVSVPVLSEDDHAAARKMTTASK